MDADRLCAYLDAINYNEAKKQFLIKGFQEGFDLGYTGDRTMRRKAPNLKLTVGSKVELWNKVMKEVKEGRYAGPFETPPFENYIQSPIGLVPKDGGRNTRLIFHLSYPRKDTKRGEKPESVNANTPKSLCTVKYPDIERAIILCLELGIGCKIAKSDMKSAFRHFYIKQRDWMLLVMKAESPLDGKIYYFFDKCLPFGAAISCAIFQAFSDAISAIVEFMTKRENINYLDDFLFAAMMSLECNRTVDCFLWVCKEIRFPVALDKTHRATTKLTFLGFLLDTIKQLVFIPLEKVQHALDLIDDMLSRKKVTLKEIQRLCGVLNFISRCVVPGRTFTRRLYALTKGLKKPHHHKNINRESRLDLQTWKTFLQSPEVYCRQFCDFSETWTPVDIDMYTDSSRKPLPGLWWHIRVKLVHDQVGFRIYP